MTTIFGKIIKRELPAEIIYEDEQLIAIPDIAPVAPVHLLIIPKKEIRDLHSLAGEDLIVLQQVVLVAQKLARRYHITDGYRLLTNSGEEAGQTVFHLHFHLIGGRRLDHLA
jgi:histidine triad (HIT) family protein